jgi:Xaa-Pro aminopeptidase
VERRRRRREKTMTGANFPYVERRRRAGKVMADLGLDALLLAKPQNMSYLCGDGRLCAFAVVTRDGRAVLGVPRTDVEEARAGAQVDEILGFETEVEMLHSIHHVFEHLGITKGKVGLENTFLTVSLHHMFRHPHALPTTLSVEDATPVMSRLRIVKEPEEVERIREAGRVAREAMEAALKSVKAGVSEVGIAAEAETAMRRAGAEGNYTTYVSSGRRSSIAHGTPSHRRLEAGDLVMIDLHPIVNGYCADMCRTICVGEPIERQKAAFAAYLKAQQKVIAAVKAGATVSGVEKLMKESLEADGFGRYFLGPPVHGVGLEFEEAPLPPGHAFFHGEKPMDTLEPNMVLAIGNCGIYLGDFGVRVEDTVLVTAEAGIQLTNLAPTLHPTGQG